jgi:hypothetical protein
MISRRNRSLISAIAMLTLPLPLMAQEQPVTPNPQPTITPVPAESWYASINPTASYTFDSSFHGTGSSYTVTRTGIDTEGLVSLSKELDMNLLLSGEYSNYRFSNPGLDVNLDLLDVNFDPGFEYHLSDHWSIFGGALFESAGDTSADVDDATTYGAYVGFKHKVSDQFSYSFGLSGSTQIKDDPRFTPIMDLDWKISDSLAFSISTSTNNAEVRLTQDLCPTISLAAVASYEDRQFRLDDKPVEHGVLRDTRLPVGLDLAWTPSQIFSAHVEAGYVLWQEIEFDDSHGYELSQRHPNPAPYVGLSAKWQF